jgi:hypothetical protein
VGGDYSNLEVNEGVDFFSRFSQHEKSDPASKSFLDNINEEGQIPKSHFADVRIRFSDNSDRNLNMKHSDDFE